MPDARLDQVHVADVALVLLEGRDLPRVGRPEENRPVAPGPARVVGGVAEVLHAVGGELPLGAGREIADPEILVPDEGAQLPIGRNDRVAEAAAGPAPGAARPAGTTWLESTTCRVRRTGSTTTNSAPAAVVFRYQKRSPSSQAGRTDAPKTSGAVRGARNFSARA